MKYRSDIDGLRALAVLPVVIFHIEAGWLPGGYVGVDVFFVISGFLITSIIQGEIERDTFTLADFYERRIRRILPALLTVVAASFAVCLVLFTQRDLYNVAQSVVAAALFVSNVLFFLEAGYFDAASHTKPLLHTWSLAIEEQFYVVVPLVLMLLTRLSRRPVVWIGGLTAASFVLCVSTTHLVPDAAFYLIPWRAWELGLGSLLALGAVPCAGRRAAREAGVVLGIALIAGAAILFDSSTPFPGMAALAPTLGAALVLHAGSGGPTLAGRLLGSAGPVWIGKLSYSLYLWHWPVVVFYIYWVMDLPGPAAALGLFALSLALAWLSWRFVERPFRRPVRVRGAATAGRRTPFVAAGAGTGMLSLAAAAVLALDGAPARLPEDARSMAAYADDVGPRYRECFVEKVRGGDWLSPCVFGAASGGPATVALWGDSHATSLLPALDRAGEQTGVKVALYAHQGCPGLVGFQVHWAGRDHDCGPFLDDTFRAIAEDPEIELVVLTKRAPVYAHGWVPYGLAERNNASLEIGPRFGPPVEDGRRTRFFLEALEKTVAALRAAGKRVALVYPLPEPGVDVPTKLARRMASGERARDLTLSRARFDARTARLLAAYDRLVAEHGLIPIRLHERICDARECRLTLEGVPIFRDETHLTATVAAAFAPRFMDLFRSRHF